MAKTSQQATPPSLKYLILKKNMILVFMGFIDNYHLYVIYQVVMMIPGRENIQEPPPFK